jgi:hypothetical protein
MELRSFFCHSPVLSRAPTDLGALSCTLPLPLVPSAPLPTAQCPAKANSGASPNHYSTSLSSPLPSNLPLGSYLALRRRNSSQLLLLASSNCFGLLFVQVPRPRSEQGKARASRSTPSVRWHPLGVSSSDPILYRHSSQSCSLPIANSFVYALIEYFWRKRAFELAAVEQENNTVRRRIGGYRKPSKGWEKSLPLLPSLGCPSSKSQHQQPEAIALLVQRWEIGKFGRL